MALASTAPLYLDHASTSYPKPAVVGAAIQRWFTELGVSADRGTSAAHEIVRAEVHDTRGRLAALVGLPPSRCAFTSGATEASNLLLRALLAPTDRVVTTAIEHAAVARPLHLLRNTMGIDVEIVPCDRFGRVDPAAVRNALISRPTRLCVLNHASNVTGAVLDVATCLAAAREAGTISIVDASQTAGVLPLPRDADYVLGSAHKALLGPPGLGFVLARSDVPFRAPKQGGSGASEDLLEHPSQWPTVLEAGTPNTPAILGLRAALISSQSRAQSDPSTIQALLDAFAERVESEHAGRSHSPRSGPRLPILSFAVPRFDPLEFAMLAAGANITLRSGFHCAPWIHEHLGTTDRGTIRISPNTEVTAGDLDRLAALLSP